MTALTIILPLYAQLALGLSVTGSAWTIIALQGAATVASVVAGRLLVRFAHYKLVPPAGLVLSVAALVPLAVSPIGYSPAVALGLIALVGLGLGPTFPFTIVIVQNTVALHQLGIATGTMNFFRALGATFIVTGSAQSARRRPDHPQHRPARCSRGASSAILQVGFRGSHPVSGDRSDLHSDVARAPLARCFASNGVSFASPERGHAKAHDAFRPRHLGAACSRERRSRSWQRCRHL